MEKNLVADARAIYKWVAEQPWCDRNQISVIGRSLGTGVAMQLAASTPVHKLVLFTPYDSLISIAKKKVPLAPVSLLLRSKFKSNECAANVRNPTFVLLAENDEVVPPRFLIALDAALRCETPGGHSERHRPCQPAARYRCARFGQSFLDDVAYPLPVFAGCFASQFFECTCEIGAVLVTHTLRNFIYIKLAGLKQQAGVALNHLAQ